MKYLLLLILSFNLYAQTATDTPTATPEPTATPDPRIAINQDFSQRWTVMQKQDGGMPGFYRAVNNEANSEIYFQKKILGASDPVKAEQRLAAIEAAYAIWTAEQAALKAAEDTRKAEIVEIKAMVSDINNSTLDAPIKKIMKILVRELKE